VADWATISSLATAGGTLVLAIATFASVRTANRSAQASERALQATIRPMLVTARTDDPPQKVGFADDHWVRVEGPRAAVDATDDAVYLAIALRNIGNGIAALDRWDLNPGRSMGTEASHRDPESFRRLTRDLFVPSGDTGFWQGAVRGPDDPAFDGVHAAVRAREAVTVDLLYSDHEGGQHAITRFTILPVGEDAWLATMGRHWELDRDAPR
jgi:hypothetical protein